MSGYTATADEIYQSAIEKLAIVQAAKLRKKSAEAATKAARGQYAPTIFLSGDINSNYSSIATRDVLLNSVDVPTSNYVEVNGSKIPVITKQPNYSSQKINYTDQLKNNFFSGLGVGIRVPILNSFQTKNKVKLAQIEYKSLELVEENTRLQLRQEIDQAYLNMSNAFKKYKISLEQVAAYTESFRAAEVRFNAGAGTSVDYLIAKNNVDRASANLIMIQYDYLLRKKILDYYKEGGYQ
jgi:outer membrane protein